MISIQLSANQDLSMMICFYTMAKRLPLVILIWLSTDFYFYQAVQILVNSDGFL